MSDERVEMLRNQSDEVEIEQTGETYRVTYPEGSDVLLVLVETTGIELVYDDEPETCPECGRSR